MLGHYIWCDNKLIILFFLVAGLIRLRSSPPPHLQGVEYVLNVTATDDNASGGPQALSSMAQVIVGVDDVNNNKPVFEKVKQLIKTFSFAHSLFLFEAASDCWTPPILFSARVCPHNSITPLSRCLCLSISSIY